LAEEGVEAIAGAIPRRALPTPSLSFAQQRLWSIHQANPASTAYTIAECVEILGPFQPQSLKAALHAIVARHESVRTAFHDDEGLPSARIVLAAEPEFTVQDAPSEE